MFGLFKKRAAEPPARLVQQWADLCAAQFDARNPKRALERCGIALRVARRAAKAAGEPVAGSFDAMKQRIEIVGCDDAHSDEEIVGTLARELYFAMAAARARVAGNAASTHPGAEHAARAFASAWLRQLEPTDVRCCAKALRAAAK